MKLYVLSSFLCLVLFIVFNCLEGMYLTFGDLIVFTIAAFVPFINFLFLFWIVLTIQLDFENIPMFTLIGSK